MTPEELSKTVADEFAAALHAYWKRDTTDEDMPPAPTIALYFGDMNRLAIMDIPGEMGALMDSATGKEIVFRTMRELRKETEPDIIALAYDAHVATETEAGRALGHDEFIRLARKHGIAWMFEQGYSTKRECVMATAQTADEIVLLIRPYAHKGGEYWTWFPDDVQQVPSSGDGFVGQARLW